MDAGWQSHKDVGNHLDIEDFLQKKVKVTLEHLQGLCIFSFVFEGICKVPNEFAKSQKV